MLRFIIKSGFKSRAGYNGACTVIVCIKGTRFQQMLNIYVNFGFWIFEKLLNLAHEKLVNILGGHGIGINIH